MSTGSVNTIVGRIKIAPVKSPIAVLISDSGSKWRLDAVFADTVKTKEYIESNPDSVVGVFNRTMNLTDVKNTLMKASV